MMIVKILHIFISLLLGLWCFLLWSWSMILAGDIPVSISFDEFKSTMIGIGIFDFVHIVYIYISKYPIFTVYFLVVPTLLWGLSLSGAYHEYSTIIDITGFTSCLLLIGYSIYKNKKLF